MCQVIDVAHVRQRRSRCRHRCDRPAAGASRSWGSPRAARAGAAGAGASGSSSWSSSGAAGGASSTAARSPASAACSTTAPAAGRSTAAPSSASRLERLRVRRVHKVIRMCRRGHRGRVIVLHGRSHQAANIDRIDRDVRMIADVDGRRDFLQQVRVDWKSASEQDECLAPRNRGEILCQVSQRQDHVVPSEIRCRAIQLRHGRVARHVWIHGRHPDALHRGFQALGIIREILDDIERSAEIHDRHQMIGCCVGIDKLGGGITRADLVCPAGWWSYRRTAPGSEALRRGRRIRVGF